MLQLVCIAAATTFIFHSAYYSKFYLIYVVVT